MRIPTETSFLRRGLALAALIAGAAALTPPAALAGECPAGKLVADGAGQKPGPAMPKDVTDMVLTSIDLSKETVAIPDHLFRIRRLEIKPGGIVPWHDHGDRPALIYIIQGEITEYASNCAVPIVHKAGDWSRDADLIHWWKNTGKRTVVLISADILHDQADQHTM